MYSLSFENNFSPPVKITCSGVCLVQSQAVSSVDANLPEPRWQVLRCQALVRPHVKNGSRHRTARDIHKWNYLQKRMNRLQRIRHYNEEWLFGLFKSGPGLSPTWVLSSLSSMTRMLVLPLSVVLIVRDKDCAPH